MGLNNMEVSKSLKNQPFGKFRYQNKKNEGIKIDKKSTL